jgi:hypothetical protein
VLAIGGVLPKLQAAIDAGCTGWAFRGSAQGSLHFKRIPCYRTGAYWPGCSEPCGRLRWAVAEEVETIRCNFIGDFRVGDNIVASCRALCRLSAKNENNTFNKLMVVQAGSIIEAALDQITYRAQQHTREGVPNIPADDLKKIRDKDIDSLSNIIQAMEKHKLLDKLGETIYKDLDRLRELRNRVHIQFDDKPKGMSRDDLQAFSKKEVDWAISLCARVLKYLGERFPRPEELGVFAHWVSVPKVAIPEVLAPKVSIPKA